MSYFERIVALLTVFAVLCWVVPFWCSVEACSVITSVWLPQTYSSNLFISKTSPFLFGHHSLLLKARLCWNEIGFPLCKSTAPKPLFLASHWSASLFFAPYNECAGSEVRSSLTFCKAFSCSLAHFQFTSFWVHPLLVPVLKRHRAGIWPNCSSFHWVAESHLCRHLLMQASPKFHESCPSQLQKIHWWAPAPWCGFMWAKCYLALIELNF